MSQPTFGISQHTAPVLRKPSTASFAREQGPAGGSPSYRSSIESNASAMSESGYDSVSTDDYAPPQRSLSECAASFHDQVQGVSNQLESLKDTYDTIFALSSRLLVLHPNSIETPTLALDLRNSLLHTASTLRLIDSNLFDLWESEERVRKAVESGEFSFDGLKGTALSIELQRRQSEVDQLVRRFRRRSKDIKSEARSEREERREVKEEIREPFGVDDYLQGGVDCPDLTKKKAVHASRWVVTNPFTILCKLLVNLKVLRIPEMIATDRTPLTFLAGSNSTRNRSLRGADRMTDSKPLMVDNPETLRRAHRLSDWKAEILRSAPSNPSSLHKAFDRVSNKMASPWYKNDARARSERWIVIGSLLLLPLILLAVLVEKMIDLTSSSSASSSARSSSSTGSFTTLFPTMMNTDETGTYDPGSQPGTPGPNSSAPGTRTTNTPRIPPPTLTAGSYRTGTSGKRKTPWYLKTVWIVLLVIALLIALGLGVGLGVGLGTQSNRTSKSNFSEAAQGGNESTVTSYSTYSSVVTGSGATTVVPVIQTNTRSQSAQIIIETIGGSTVTALTRETQGAGSGVFVTVSETLPPSTRTNIVYVTTLPSTQTVTTTLAGGIAQTVFETITLRRTVTALATARP
ncbi:hypothetical protein JCM3765_003286 [Sporobolomyces pararoseus]